MVMRPKLPALRLKFIFIKPACHGGQVMAMVRFEDALDRVADVETFAADVVACDGDVLLEFALVMVKLADVVSCIEGGAQAGLREICKVYLPSWERDLESYGLFGNVASPATAGVKTEDAEHSDAHADLALVAAPSNERIAPAPATGRGRGRAPGRRRLRSARPQLASAPLASSPQADYDARLAAPALATAGPRRSGSASSVETPQPGTLAELGPAPAPVATQAPFPATAGVKRRRPTEPYSPTVNCQCPGMCGAKACDARRNRNHRYGETVACPELPVPERAYCSFCLCEVSDCPGPRHRSRWCKKHASYYRDDGDSRRYSNPFLAKAPLPSKWSLELQVTAKLHYALPHMTPDDLTVLLDWAPVAELTPQYLVALFLAHSLKWPHAVRSFIAAVGPAVSPAMAGWESDAGGVAPAMAGRESDAGGANAAVARQFAAAYRQAILAHNGLQVKGMFDRMNTGLMHAQTGLAVQGAELGILLADPPPRSRNTSRLGTATAVTLGPALKKYWLAEAQSPAITEAASLIEELLHAAAKARIKWPADDTPSNITKFGDAVLGLAKIFRSTRVGQSGFRGGLDGAHEYKVKSYTRVLLMMMHESRPNSISQVTYGDLMCYLPDERNYTEVLADLRAVEVQRLTNVSPLMLSCWTCLFGGMRELGRLKQLLGVSSRLVLRVLADDCERQRSLSSPDGPFRMGPRALAEAVSSVASASSSQSHVGNTVCQ
jgi:hypothetical protein